MPDYVVSVGNVEVISLSDGSSEFPAANVFSSVSAAEWEEYPGALSSEGKLKTNFGCFALRSQGQTIIVDTGFGPGLPGRLPEELRSKGVDPKAVTVVVITHLHPDHLGGNLTQKVGRTQPTFPNARYRIPKGDWDYFRQPEVFEQAAHV